MVFESVLTDLLNRFLKPYVKKLDTSQLKLGIWGGRMQLVVACGCVGGLIGVIYS